VVGWYGVVVVSFVVLFGWVYHLSNRPPRSTRSCITLGSLNRVPALIGWSKGGNVTSAGWQVTLRDPVACEP